jgi:putative tryptophan/tyrosine transport system substrate-binding protein
VKRHRHTKTVLLLIGFVFASIHSAEAQQEFRTPVIGFLSSSGDRANPGPHAQAFRQRLRELGYEEGKNIRLEYRSALGRLDHLPALVDELVQLRVDVLVVTAQPAINAAKKTTKTIPIVMISSIDPVAAGHVNSLARPGGNLTGVSQLTRDLSAKRVELLKEIAPRMSRLGIVWDLQGPGPKAAFKEYEAAARLFNIPLQSLELSGPNPDLEGAFKAAKSGRSDALIVVANPLVAFHRKRVIELAGLERLPAMYEDGSFVEGGGLLSYAGNIIDVYRGAANYVDKILKGAKPADLPIEQPTKFELVINLKAAKQIGLTIPPNVLARADKVIK